MPISECDTCFVNFCKSNRATIFSELPLILTQG